MTRHERFDKPQEQRKPLAVIGMVQKNSNEKIRVTLDQFNDFKYCDIRVGVSGNADEFIPTKKGVAVPLHRLPAIIELLTAAHAEARRLKLFDHPTRDL